MPGVFSLPENGKSTPKYNGVCTYLILSPKGKPYVGQTKTFRKRMNSHKSKAKFACINHEKWKAGKHNRVCAIHFAINKYGWENMEIIILEKYFVWDQLFLDKREQYFIRFYDSFKNGYNENKGGNGGGHPTSEEAKAKIGAANTNNTYAAKPVTSREIKKEYSDGTQLVNFVFYASAREAERQTGVRFGDISACCLKQQKTAGGRYWNFAEDDDFEGEHRVPRIGDIPLPNKRALFSMSPTGVKQLHDSSCAASRTLSELTGKKFSQGHISSCCLKKRKSHHKYKFYHATSEMIAKFKNTKKRKR